jgi:methylamine utilization protein MauE
MFDTSSFRIRYKAPVEKPLLIAVGPLLVAAVLAIGLWSRFGYPISIGPWISSDLLALLVPIAALAAVALLIERLFGVDEGYPWRRSVAATGAGVVGGTLLVGAWGKVLDPLAFAGSLRQEGLTGWLDRFAAVPATVPPLVVVAIEVFLGALLVLGVRNRQVLASSALLVAFFLFLTGRAYWRDAHGIVSPEAASCGCFGNLLDRTPKEAFWQDLALLVPGLLFALLAVIQRHTLGRRILLAAATAVAAVTLGWFAPTLPIDDLATRLDDGAQLSAMCAGRGEDRLCMPTLIPELQHGTHLVVLIDLARDGMENDVEQLNRYWLSGVSPRLWVLAAGTPEQSKAFFWKYGPSFEIREVPPSLLRPLYRSLPRSFRVLDGRVTRTWSGLPPLDEPVPAG